MSEAMSSRLRRAALGEPPRMGGRAEGEASRMARDVSRRGGSVAVFREGRSVPLPTGRTAPRPKSDPRVSVSPFDSKGCFVLSTVETAGETRLTTATDGAWLAAG
jgi:hypothetical protein